MSTPAFAEEHRLQGWFLSMAQAKVHGNGWVFVEFQPRATFLPSEAAKIDQVILRAAVGWQLFRTVSLWEGAAVVNGEQRVFEQGIWADNFGPVRLLVRARLEHRWLPDGSPVKHRARVQFRVAWTFFDPFLLIAYDEPFVNFVGGFDQNRAYVAFGWRPHPKVLVEVGYLNQYTSAQRVGHTPIVTVGVGF